MSISVCGSPCSGVVQTKHLSEMDRSFYSGSRQAEKDHQDGHVTSVSGMKTTCSPPPQDVDALKLAEINYTFFFQESRKLRELLRYRDNAIFSILMAAARSYCKWKRFMIDISVELSLKGRYVLVSLYYPVPSTGSVLVLLYYLIPSAGIMS